MSPGVRRTFSLGAPHGVVLWLNSNPMWAEAELSLSRNRSHAM